VLPLFLVAFFAGLLGWAAKDSVLPSKQVTVVPVIVARAEVQQADTPLFQAAGWVEPRPASLVVSALAPGVIEELVVVEGQLLRKGDPIAHLLDTDAKITLGETQAELAIRDAEVDAARAEFESAEIALANPIQLKADLAEADADLSQVEAVLDTLPAALEAAQTRRTLANETVEKKLLAGSAVAGRALREAKADLATETATADQLVARFPVLKRQREALLRKRDALQEQRDLKLEPKRRFADAEAALKIAQAKRTRASLAVESAKLQLARMTIKSPVDGRVLSLQAAPGMRVVGLDPHSEKGSSAVVTLYDPAMLQVRVDVRLEDVPQVQLGQKARIETPSVPDGVDGEVIGVTSQADIQKNTLQVKVAVVDPPDVIRPEMLGQVTFLAPEPTESETNESEERLRILIPRQLVASGEEGTYVWLADRTVNVAQRRMVTLGRAGTEDLVEIVSGLTPTDKLISGGREGLDQGDRISVTAEDAMLGISGAPMLSPPTTPRTAQRPATNNPD
ncbi:MAG TPA: efflux RND transporter periplasmic adaptor subunit, partial [Pirellulales bacterium]|nr:efflux RND transporter periplasmic adaptor subunit [Pirellulales bacterium]